MPQQVIPPSSNGTTVQWDLFGAGTEWEAVLRDSSDSSFIQTATFGALSEFNCGAGYQPVSGRIMAVTLHYRMRAINAGSGAVVDVQITRSGAPYTAGTVPLPTSNWVEGKIRLREDWLTSQRFTIDGVADLGIAVEVATAPTSGAVQVSQLWLAVEYVEGPYIYDPYSGLEPDGITGPLGWVKGGAAPTSITGDNYLRVDNYSPNFLVYGKPLPTAQFAPRYITEVETGIRISNVNPTDQILGIAVLDEVPRPVQLVALQVGGVQYLALTNNFVVSSDLSQWPAVAAFNYEDEELQLHLKIDRDDLSGALGRVDVYVNYAETPLLSCSYYDFPEGSPLGGLAMGFGNPDVNCRYEFDYFAYHWYLKRGDTFSGWKDSEFGGNEITADSSDADIVKPVEINPPGVLAGQSAYACFLDVQDTTEDCETTQTYLVPSAAPQTYKIDLDYKQDTTTGFVVDVVVQRLPDLYYWDDVGKAWDPSYQSVSAPVSTTRSRASMVTGLSVPSVDNTLLITVKTTVVGPSPASHTAWIYKVYLDEE